MAGRNIGHVEFLVDFDGDHLPRQARQIGEKAGAQMGDGIDKGSDEALSKFGSRLRKEMDENGRSAGKSFSDAFDDSINRNLDDTVREVNEIFSKEKGFDRYAESFDTIGDASDDLDRKLERLHSTGRITDDQFLEMIDTQREFTLRSREAADEVARERAELSDLLDGRLNTVLDDLADKKREDALATRLQREENERLERVVNDIRYDRFLEELTVTETKHKRAAQAADQAAKFAAKEAGAVERATASHASFNNEGTKTERVLGRIASRLKNVNVSFRELPHGLKQAAFYTGLFTALAPGIAVLGSVSGSGLMSLATGVGALGIGLAAVIPGFRGMLDDVSKLPPKARDAATAMQAFRDPLFEMQDAIQEGMFDGLGDEIDALRTRVLPRVTVGMQKTATTVNGIFDRMLDRITSDRGVKRLDSIFTGLQPTLASLGDATLNLGGAFSGIFEAAIPSGQGFASFLENVTGRFNAWVNDRRGRDALAEWFANLGKIAPGVGDLIGAAGKSIADLVTDKAVSNMQAFLGTMTEAVPKVVGGLGGLIDTVDPLGLAAEAVNGIGDFFSRNAPGIERFGSAANRFVRDVGGQLGGVLGSIGDELIEISPDILDSLGEGITSIGKAINSPEGKEAISKLGDTLVTAGDAVGDLLTDLGDSGAIVDALTAIGKAAELASKGIELFNDGNKLMNGDLDPELGSEESQKAIENYKKGGKEGFGQAWKDFWSLDPKDGLRLQKSWGFDGGFAAGEGIKEGLERQKGPVANKGREVGEAGGKAYGEGVESGLPTAGEKFDQLFGGDAGKGAAGKAGEAAGKMYGSGVGNGLPTAGEKFDQLFGGDAGKGAAEASGEAAGSMYGTGVGNGLPTAGEKFDQLFGGDAGKGAADGAGNEAGGKYGLGVNNGLLGGNTPKFDQLFGGDAGKGAAENAGEAAGSMYGTGVGNGLPTAGEKFDQVFGGDAGKGAAESAGEAAGSMYGTGVGNGLPTAGQKFDQLFGGDAGKTAATGAGTAAGNAFAGAVPLAMTNGSFGIALAAQTASNQMVTPFDTVPGRVQTAVSGTPSAVGGVMAQVTGQPGADGTVNPFNSVSGRVQTAINGTPGSVAGVMGRVTGQTGADRTVSPFSAVPGKIQSNINGTPGAVSGVMGRVSGQTGANNTVNPFIGTAGRIGAQVSPAPGLIRGVLAGINDFGAAGRIVAAFKAVPSLVSGALAGLGGIVAGALATARNAVNIGVAGIRSLIPKTATGGAFNGAQIRIIGEAGPEAVVPLNRPLSRVDPSVRELSAIAQGKAKVGGGGGIQTYIADGAIRVEAPNANPQAVAAATVDRIVAKAL